MLVFRRALIVSQGSEWGKIFTSAVSALLEMDALFTDTRLGKPEGGRGATPGGRTERFSAIIKATSAHGVTKVRHIRVKATRIVRAPV